MRTWLALLVVFVAARPVHAWGSSGHEIVGEIAERLVMSRTRDEIATLLEPGRRLAEIADWADDYRKRCRNTGPWHYVNIPLDAAGYVRARDCSDAAGSCVIRAIDDARTVLGDRARPTAARRLALHMLVHFVADLHQPLHAGSRADRGGNDLRVRFERRETNLHRVWDHDLIAWTGRSVAAYSDMLVRSLRAPERQRLSGGSVVQWAEESQRAARHAYAGLPLPLRDAPPISLDDRYAKSMLRLLDAQLLRAGVRLAHTLDSVLAKRAPAAGDAVVEALLRCAYR